MSSIITYIQNNSKLVDDWLTSLFGEYLKRSLLNPDTDVEVPTNSVCRDKRKLKKC